MNAKELIEELQKLPKDYEICVHDSYGAFQDFNFITRGHTVERRHNDEGKSKKFYVLETHYDCGGYLWNENPIKESKPEPIYEHQREIAEILDAIGGKHYRFNSNTKLSDWEPTISGGNEQDKLDMKNLNREYWKKLTELMSKNKAQISYYDIKDMTLLKAAYYLNKINNLKA